MGDSQEKGACSKISQALNRGQSVALRTTEMTALAVLNGTIGMALHSTAATEVAFETVKEKVRSELDIWVDDPDVIEAFDFVINLGATKTRSSPAFSNGPPVSPIPRDVNFA